MIFIQGLFKSCEEVELNGKRCFTPQCEISQDLADWFQGTIKKILNLKLSLNSPVCEKKRDETKKKKNNLITEFKYNSNGIK